MIDFINFISNLAMPLIILIIVVYGFLEKKEVFDKFVEGAKDGIKIVINIFPTLIGLFLAVGVLRSSGVIDIAIKLIDPILNFVNFPSEIIPLAILRPISGSSSIAIATDIMKNFGVDSQIGIMAAVIMGATETTLYTIAVYSASVKIKKTRFALIAALTADIVGIIVSVAVCRFLSQSFS